MWVNLQLSNSIQGLISFLLLSATLIGQNYVTDVSKVGTTAGGILDMPVSARSLAMGNSISGLGVDASALFINPAATTRLDQGSITATYMPWLADTRLQCFALSMPLSQGFVFGTYITSWSMDDMPVRTEIQQDGTGDFFNAGDLVAAVVVGKQLTDRFSIGLGVKYLQERIWHSTAKGYAMDFGTVYRTNILGDLTMITVLSNYGTDMQMNGRDQSVVHDPDTEAEGNNGNIPAEYTTDRWPLPLSFRFGLSSKVISNNLFSVAVEFDAIHPSNNYESIDLGVEILILDYVYIRLGKNSLFQNDAIEGLSLGGGVKFPINTKAIVFNYGYRDFGHLGYLQAFSVSATL